MSCVVMSAATLKVVAAVAVAAVGGVAVDTVTLMVVAAVGVAMVGACRCRVSNGVCGDGGAWRWWVW